MLNTLSRILKQGLDSFQLKVVALIFMTIDHFGRYQTFTISRPVNDAFMILGRIAAPLFLFLLVEGLRHTRSKKKYMLRLYAAGVLISIGNTVFERLFASDYFSILGNILPTFFYVAFYTVCVECIVAEIKEKRIYRTILPVLGMLFSFSLTDVYWATINLDIPAFAGILINTFLPSPFNVEYSFIFVLLGVVWYFMNNRVCNCALFAVLCTLSYFVPDQIFLMIPTSLEIFRPIYFSWFDLFTNPQWCMVFSIPFMLAYNGRKGRSCKYLFYFYYPLHQYILFFLQIARH